MKTAQDQTKSGREVDPATLISLILKIQQRGFSSPLTPRTKTITKPHRRRIHSGEPGTPATTSTPTHRRHTFLPPSPMRETLSPLPRATTIPGADAAAASPTAGETRRRRRQSPPEASPVRTHLRESSLFSFLLLRARYARSRSSAVARHAAPTSRLPTQTAVTRTAATTPLSLAESTVGVNTFLCSKLQPAAGDILSSLFLRLGLIGCE
ncbi:hypothetical protein DEO72_LG7g819 [Vigna unguiculata]|uniref:Uncharacterized protein n=1 Tax=Vigna unguiculata TaxID=3917 RepID=A0A4D6MHQ9_VIGUN|nr:hypothetical protein DEO72_LG7g819 [Vigna unguiculata]